MLRVKGVKFGPLFDLVLIGDARQLEVFTLTGILLLGLQRRIQAVFEIGNCFWAHKNWCPNFDRSTEDIILILFNSC